MQITQRKLKPTHITEKSNLRKEHFFLTQNKKRNEALDEVRKKAIFCLYELENNRSEYKALGFLASQLMYPEYFIEIPANLAQEWYIYQRLEGTRAILIAEDSLACIISKTGEVIKLFKSNLLTQGCTVLDCIYVNQPMTNENLSNFPFILVTDCITWNDYQIEDSSFECRKFFLQSKFEEMNDSLLTVSRYNEIRIKLVEFFSATPENISRLYHEMPLEGIKDGLTFIHQEALYVSGVSQLFLLWRDANLSRYPIDSYLINDKLTISSKQVVNLRLRLKDGALLTYDKIKVGRIDPKNIESVLSKLPPTGHVLKWLKGSYKISLLVRAVLNSFNRKTAKIDENEGFMDFTIIGSPSLKRKFPDTFSRIIHQYILRNNKPFITLNDVVSAAHTGISNQSALFINGNMHIESFLDSDSSDEVSEYC